MRGVWGWFCVDNISVCPCLHLHRHSFTHPTPPPWTSHSICPLHPAPYLVIGDLLYVEVSGIVDGHPGVAVVNRAECWPGSSVVEELVMSLPAALSKEQRTQSNQQLGTCRLVSLETGTFPTAAEAQTGVKTNTASLHQDSAQKEERKLQNAIQNLLIWLTNHTHSFTNKSLHTHTIFH